MKEKQRKDRNQQHCVLSVIALVLGLILVALLLFFAVRFYVNWCTHSPSSGFGSWILAATWILIPVIILCFAVVVRSFRFWKEKVIHNGVWCIDHDWDGCTCRRCGEHRDEGHHWDQCVCKLCGATRHTSDKYCTCTRCGKEMHLFETREEKVPDPCTECGNCTTASGKPDPSITIRKVKVCKRCGKKEEME